MGSFRYVLLVLLVLACSAHPIHSQSHLKTNSGLLGEGQFQTSIEAVFDAVHISWESTPNIPYRIQFSTNLLAESWEDLSPPIIARTSLTSVTNSIDGMQSFFRVQRLDSVTNSIGMKLVWIPPGTFVMGSPDTDEDLRSTELPQREVTITRGFWMAEFEATLGNFGETNEWLKNKPILGIEWITAMRVCKNYSEEEHAAGRLLNGYVYRLPTEAEWEYACRAESTTRFHYGDDPGYTNLSNFAVYGKRINGPTDFGGRENVGGKSPNAWGLYDMYGNAGEWTQDMWRSSYAGLPTVDPFNWDAEEDPVAFAVMRGGAWYHDASWVRTAVRIRHSLGSDGNSPDTGFRLILGNPYSLEDTFWWPSWLP